MNQFLEKHQIDVGKTLGTIMLFCMIVSIYKMLLELIIGDQWILNLGFIALYFQLGTGMYQHKKVARWCCIRLTVLVAILTPYIIYLSIWPTGTFILEGGDYKLENPPTWKVILCSLSMIPLIWCTLSMLFSKKAKEEFGVR